MPRYNLNPKIYVALAVVVLLVGSFYFFGLYEYFSAEYINAQREALLDYYADNAVLVIVAFMLLYVALTGLSIPSAAVLTLLAGVIFDLYVGVVVVSFASTIGATLAFLLARYLLRDLVQNRFGEKLKPMNEGVEREGGFYVFALRLVPLFPYAAINLVMGLTPLRVWTFYWVSQIGMLAGTIVYVNAGAQLGQLRSLDGILSPTLIGSFVLLGIFPLIAKKVLDLVKKRFFANTGTSTSE